jgi:hypothetical protein
VLHFRNFVEYKLDAENEILMNYIRAPRTKAYQNTWLKLIIMRKLCKLSSRELFLKIRLCDPSQNYTIAFDKSGLYIRM